MSDDAVPMNCSTCALWQKHDAEDLALGAWPNWGECEAAETDVQGVPREETLMVARGLDNKHGYLITRHDFECCMWVER